MVGLASLLALLAAAGGFAQSPPAPPTNPADRIVALDPRWTVSFATPPAAPAGYDQQFGPA